MKFKHKISKHKISKQNIFERNIEVFYDGDCPMCRWEVRLYSHLDSAQNIIWTDIETLDASDLPIGKTRKMLLSKFHVRDLDAGALQVWYIGVEAFARIWRALPGLRYLAFLFSVPILRHITGLAYKLFLKWQGGNRRRRIRKSGLDKVL